MFLFTTIPLPSPTEFSHSFSLGLGDTHTQIFCICFSDDGKTLISASKDMTARQWDLTTGKCLMTFVGHTMCLLATAFIDENKIATASQDATLRVWDVKTGNCLIALQPDALPVLCCAFAPNRKVAVTGSSEGTVNMFDCSNAVFIRTLRGHVGAVCALLYPSNKLEHSYHVMFVFVICGAANNRYGA